ncbi:hypothetical protein AKJ37_07200 [candidate division MSBL1 archaeon SCGC-AAA259I09]|uniref:Uncharacterized protein n=1 Tax=candidate division MSBL1 archaeon SCGC-AAA259I09 TaxID=1698267 RepID=A0A133UL37_9EURY|nr:hypothetical protein AKJ37_07200 [candidate division MSBL1 archaeon SCGC-AAA259I09]
MHPFGQVKVLPSRSEVVTDYRSLQVVHSLESNLVCRDWDSARRTYGLSHDSPVPNLPRIYSRKSLPLEAMSLRVGISVQDTYSLFFSNLFLMLYRERRVKLNADSSPIQSSIGKESSQLKKIKTIEKIILTKFFNQSR